MKRISDSWLSVGSLPTSEIAAERSSRRPTLPVKAVVRVELPRSRGNSKHVRVALSAFLKHPAKLPPDPGPGIYAITVRLNLAEVAQGMALAKEPGRAAFIRRVLEWQYPSSPTNPTVSAMPSPIVSPVQQPAVSQPQWRPKLVPLPATPTNGCRPLSGPEFERLIYSYGYSLSADENAWRYFLLPDGVIEQCERASGRIGARWVNPFR